MRRILAFALLTTACFAQTGTDINVSSSKTQIALVLNEIAADPAGPAPSLAIEPTRFDSCEESVLTHACRLHWRSALTQAAQFLAMQHAMNLGTYHGTLQGPFFHDWFNSVHHYRFSRFQDDDPFIVNYIGHPMMGSVASWIEIQNDPRGMRQTVGWRKSYWRSRAKALAFASVYAAQWELGPLSETSIGNLGSFRYYSESGKHTTNGTGFTDLLVTPTAGVTWSIGEDLIDKFVIRRLEGHSRNPMYQMGISVLNPTRSLANLLRMKAPWYRDTRLSSGRANWGN